MNGLPLDSIEANVESTHGNVDGANKQLSDASLYQVKRNISLLILSFHRK